MAIFIALNYGNSYAGSCSSLILFSVTDSFETALECISYDTYNDKNLCIPVLMNCAVEY